MFALGGLLKPDSKSKPPLFVGPGELGAGPTSVYCLRGGPRPPGPGLGPPPGPGRGPPPARGRGDEDEYCRWGLGAESAENCR